MCASTSCESCPLRRVKGKACLISLIKEYEVEKVTEQLGVLSEFDNADTLWTWYNCFADSDPLPVHEEVDEWFAA